MKRQKCDKYIKKEGDNGFTLIEVLVAIVILSVGLLGMASLTVGIIKGNKLSGDLTTATTLAQDKMEEIRGLGYSGMPTATTTTPTIEDYSTIPGYAEYKRATETTVGSPASDMKTITVTTYWDSDAHSVELKTILAE